jgi:hypothetical protein
MPTDKPDRFAIDLAAFIDEDEYEIRIKRMAEELGVPESMVRRWANGLGSPHPSIQKKAEALLKRESRK